MEEREMLIVGKGNKPEYRGTYQIWNEPKDDDFAIGVIFANGWMLRTYGARMGVGLKQEYNGECAQLDWITEFIKPQGGWILDLRAVSKANGDNIMARFAALPLVTGTPTPAAMLEFAAHAHVLLGYAALLGVEPIPIAKGESNIVRTDVSEAVLIKIIGEEVLKLVKGKHTGATQSETEHTIETVLNALIQLKVILNEGKENRNGSAQ